MTKYAHSNMWIITSIHHLCRCWTDSGCEIRRVGGKEVGLVKTPSSEMRIHSGLTTGDSGPFTPLKVLKSERVRYWCVVPVTVD